MQRFDSSYRGLTALESSKFKNNFAEGCVIELYQQALKQHNSNPVGLSKPIQATHTADGYNASCGDEITFSLELSSDHKNIIDISFECDCCAICKASASALCAVSEGRDTDFLKQQTDLLIQLLGLAQPHVTIENFEKQLEFLLPIKKHISRHNCALLPWQTALEAIACPITPPTMN